MLTSVCQLNDGLAVYLETALQHQQISQELCSFFESIMFKTDMAKNSQLVEFVHEAMETACGVKASLEGSLDTKYVINCLTLASTLQGPSDIASEVENARFI